MNINITINNKDTMIETSIKTGSTGYRSTNIIIGQTVAKIGTNLGW